MVSLLKEREIIVLEKDIPARGKFVIMEGADGSGKSTLARALVAELNNRGITASLSTRETASEFASFNQAIAAVRNLFFASESSYISFDLLALGAALQYGSILQGTIIPALERGELVVADSWWGKTLVHLWLESDYLQRQQRVIGEVSKEWLLELGKPLDQKLNALGTYVILLDTPVEDRWKWYSGSGAEEWMYAQICRDEKLFLAYSSRMQQTLAEIGGAKGWLPVQYGENRSIEDVTSEVIDLIGA
jgi:thymidylate kinase